MSSDVPWHLSIAGGMEAHFLQPNGASRPGVDWSLVLTRGADEKRLLVRTYLDCTPRTQEQHAAAAVAFISDLLTSGWDPNLYAHKPGELTVPDAMPQSRIAPKPWWRFW